MNEQPARTGTGRDREIERELGVRAQISRHVHAGTRDRGFPSPCTGRAERMEEIFMNGNRHAMDHCTRGGMVRACMQPGMSDPARGHATTLHVPRVAPAVKRTTSMNKKAMKTRAASLARDQDKKPRVKASTLRATMPAIACIAMVGFAMFKITLE